MSKTYIRLYCNDQKIRSCCNTKWKRDKYFDNLFIDVEYDKMTGVSRELYARFLLSQTPHKLRATKKILEYKIEIVKKGRSGNKRVAESIKLRYRIYPHAIPTVYKLEEFLEEGEYRVYYIMITDESMKQW